MSRINSVSTTKGLIPLPEELNIGQIAINLYDGLLYIKTKSGVVICVGADVTQFATVSELQQSIGGIDLSAYALTATVTQSLATIGQQLQVLADAITGKAALSHGHGIAEIAGLGANLSGLAAEIATKQPAGNYQPAGSYATQTDLSGKAPIGGVSGTWTVGGVLTANVLKSDNYIAAGPNTTIRIGTATVLKAPQAQGWQNPTGAISTATFNSASVTLNELAKRVGAIQTALIYHGILATTGTTIV